VELRPLSTAPDVRVSPGLSLADREATHISSGRAVHINGLSGGDVLVALTKQSFDELFGMKFTQVLGALSEPHVSHR
jgi:hypothetical protein